MQSNIWLVYHRTAPDFLARSELWQDRNRHFRLVALLQARSLAEVFQLTNHIEQDWRLNALVRSLSPDPLRSTSVGDVLVQGNRAWMVMPSGFLLLNS